MNPITPSPAVGVDDRIINADAMNVATAIYHATGQIPRVLIDAAHKELRELIAFKKATIRLLSGDAYEVELAAIHREAAAMAAAP